MTSRITTGWKGSQIRRVAVESLLPILNIVEETNVGQVAEMQRLEDTLLPVQEDGKTNKQERGESVADSLHR